VGEEDFYEVIEFKDLGNRVTRRARVPVMDKEEVIKAIEFGDPKQVPCWIGGLFTQEISQKYGEKLSVLLEKYPDDLIPAYYEVPDWGVKASRAKGGVGEQIASLVLDSWDKLPEYLDTQFPDLGAPGGFDSVQQIVRNYPDKYIMGMWWFFIFERMHLLRGMENVLSDLYLHPKEIQLLGERLLDYFLGIVHRFAKAGVDGIFTSDDWGSQHDLLIHPAIWRKVFKPWYKTFIEEIHKCGMHAMLHSCGNITKIIPDLIEIGLDVIHPIQPYAMDAKRIVDDFGGKICFFSGIDVQYLLPQGTPDQVERGIKELIETFDTGHGGLLIAPANNIMPETPLQNIQAMFEALQKCTSRDRENFNWRA